MGVALTVNNLPQEKANVLARLWRGDIPLWKSYWLYGSLAGIILNVIVTLTVYQTAYYAENFSKFDLYLISYLLIVITILYSVIVFVAIWRSANKYRALYPEKRGWATLAQVAVVLGGLSLIGSLANTFLNSGKTIDEIKKTGATTERMQLQATIAGLNKDLPKMIDSITRLNKIDINDSGFVYFETITTNLDDTTLLQKRVKPNIAKGLCAHPDTFEHLKDGLSFRYVYSDGDGKHLDDVVITKADCP